MTDETISRSPIASQPVHERLNPTEYQVLLAVGKGERHKTIAARLGLQISSIASAKVRIAGKTGLENDAQIAVYAYVHGLVKMELP